MPRVTETRLASGERCPHLVCNKVGSGTVRLPASPHDGNSLHLQAFSGEENACSIS